MYYVLKHSTGTYPARKKTYQAAKLVADTMQKASPDDVYTVEPSTTALKTVCNSTFFTFQ